MVELLLKKGEIVVATARKPEVLDDIKAKHPATQFIAVKLDVDKTRDITDAFAQAKKAFGRVDVVFNNAGWGAVGETEAHPEEEARKSSTRTFGAPQMSAERLSDSSEKKINPQGDYLSLTPL